jgi:hypothetical protein
MDPQSVAALPLSSNDITHLAQIIEAILQYYCTNASPFEKDYVKEISTLMGLGFTAIMVDGDLLSIYQPHFNTFLRYSHFKKHPSYLGVLSRAIAELTAGSAHLFRSLGYPAYHEHFMVAVKNTVNNIVVHLMGKAEESKRLTKILCQKHMPLF